MNFGELALAAITFIFIRNRSARFNATLAPTSITSHRGEDLFPDELDDELDVSVRDNSKEPRFDRSKDTSKSDDTCVAESQRHQRT